MITNNGFLKIENAILFAACIGVQPEALVPTANSVDYNALIDEIDAKIKHIVEQVTDGAPWYLFKDVHDKMKQDKAKLQRERDSQKLDIDQSDLAKWVDELLNLADKAKAGNKAARLKCRTLIKSVCKNIVIKLRGHDSKSEPLVTVTYITDEQFKFKVASDGALRFVDNDMAVNRRLKPLFQND
ncbi:TPA: hypothetical protein ACX6SL_001005 [Photobacterium damselae]